MTNDVRETVIELRAMICRAYNTMNGALDCIQKITEMPGVDAEMIREGVAEVANHTRDRLGLKRDLVPYPEQLAKDQK